MSDQRPDDRVVRMRTNITIAVIVTGIIIFFAAYYAASNNEEEQRPQDCIRDPRTNTWSCVDY